MNTNKIIDDAETREYRGAGIYAIVNNQTGKMYVGSTNDICNRIKQHASSFSNSKANKKIMEDVLNGHTFHSVILEKINLPCTIGFLREKEREYIKKYNTVKHGYNEVYPFMMYNPEKLVHESIVSSHILYTFNAPREDKKAWQAAADSENISLSEFIKRCVNEKISHDKGRQ